MNDHSSDIDTSVAADVHRATETSNMISARTRYAVVGVIAVLAFSAAYGVASASSRTGAAARTADQVGATAGSGPGAPSGPGADQGGGACGGGCCGSSAGVDTEGETSLQGEVQVISVDVSAGYFDPNVIRAKAGIPIEITFGEGSGCLAEVLFPQFDVHEDLTQGGATVNLPALDPGTYGFSCGMEMVFGTLVVE